MKINGLKNKFYMPDDGYRGFTGWTENGGKLFKDEPEKAPEAGEQPEESYYADGTGDIDDYGAYQDPDADVSPADGDEAGYDQQGMSEDEQSFIDEYYERQNAAEAGSDTENSDEGGGESDDSSDSGEPETWRDKLSKAGFRDVDRERGKYVKKNYVLRALIAAAIVIGLGLFLSSDFFAVTKIDVEGNYYYTDNEIITMAQAKTGVNIFREFFASDIRDRLKKNSYFTSVKLGVKLPGTLVIKVGERDQLAALVYGGSYIVLDSKGSVLRTSKEDPHVTLVEGLKITSMAQGKRIGVNDEKKFGRIMNLLKSMRAGDFYFKKIDASDVYYKAYITDSLMVNGTYSEINGALEAGSLQKVVAKLLSEKTQRGTITITSEDNISFSPDI